MLVIKKINKETNIQLEKQRNKQQEPIQNTKPNRPSFDCAQNNNTDRNHNAPVILNMEQAEKIEMLRQILYTTIYTRTYSSILRPYITYTDVMYNNHSVHFHSEDVKLSSPRYVVEHPYVINHCLARFGTTTGRRFERIY